MKRLLCTLLIAAMLLSMFLLPACSDKTNPADTQGTTLPSGTTASDPTSAPTDPTDEPTDPTDEPTDPIDPTEDPTEPTEAPTDPTEAPTDPTEAPTSAPTEAPTQKPTEPPATEPPATEPPATEPPTEPEHIKILGPEGEVFPYVDTAKKYLLEGGNVGMYTYPSTKTGVKPIEIKWKADFTPSEFIVRYGTDESFTTYKEVVVPGTQKTVSVYNLLKAATYYVQVSAVDDAGKEHVANSSFYTTSMGPRVIYIEGAYNIRDVGGYTTSFGKTTLQNMVFRGDALTPDEFCYAQITGEGKRVMSEELGIKLEIDMRMPNYGTSSVIPGAAKKYCPLSGYSDAFSNPSGYIALFKELAKPESYPVYMHCSGGADRTGTVCFLLNALLGVDENVLIQDYEFTTFSDYGIRSTQSGDYYVKFMTFYNTLKTYEGDTLAQKVESYLKHYGVTQAEIDAIRGIMFGEIPIPSAEG